MTMKYAIRSDSGVFLSENHVGAPVPAFHAMKVDGALLFASIRGALHALQTRTLYHEVVADCTVVGVEEIPGETRREVVEMEGVVDLTGMKFTLRTLSYDELPQAFYVPGRVIGWEEDIRAAVLFDSPEAVWQSVKDNNRKHIHPLQHKIVGIREVTTEPTRRVVELGPVEGHYA